MLLREVLTKEIPQIKKSQIPVNDIINNPNNKLIGVGAQAMAYLHKRFPDKVIKTIQISGPDDPSYQFLRLCVRYKNNPYFPKIYNMKMYPSVDVGYRMRGLEFDEIDCDGEHMCPPDRNYYTLIIVTEKLNPLGRISEDDILRLGIDRLDFTGIDLYTGDIQGSKFRRAFESPNFRKQILQHTTDPMLRQALRLLEPLFHNYHPDMHQNNVMTRPNGEWVFADPIIHK